ncbi:MAG TPA: head-tail adaptor protein [Chloroflexota bacterium]|nr:head-tail adaptor protein [Chloroflexota bacterium]
MLSTGELAAIQAEAALLLPDTAEIQRPTAGAQDGMGGTTMAWQTVATVPCAVGPRPYRPDESVVAAQLGTQAAWIVLLPVGTDVQPQDRIVVGPSTFEVAAPLGPRTWEFVREIACVQVL